MKNISTEKTILIVDDSATNRILLERLLKRNGYATISACGGYECLEKIRRYRPDMVLLDIMMPDMSGINVTKALQKDPEVNTIPVIFVTSATDDGTLKQAFEAGGTDFVRKPVNKVELLKRIQSVFEYQLLAEKKMQKRNYCVLCPWLGPCVMN